MNRFKRNTIVAASLLAWAGLPTTAQTTAVVDPRAEQVKGQLNTAGATAQKSENGAVDAAPQRNDVSIVAGKDQSVAKIALTRELAGGKFIGTLSTPVNRNDDATRLFTLDGPAEDVQLGFAWKKQSYNLDRLSQIDFPEQEERRESICKKYNYPACIDDTDLEKAMEKAGLSTTERSKALKSFNAVKLLGSNQELSVFQALPFHYLSLDGSLGRTERKFFDLPGSEKKDSRLSYSLSASFGRIFQASRFTVGLTAQREFQDNRDARKCTVVAGSTLERCQDLPLGEAAMVDSEPLVLEYRIWRRSFAVSPKLVYDFKRHVAAASLPIYLFANSSGKLTGGVRVDWEEHQHPVASVFVSSPLDLD